MSASRAPAPTPAAVATPAARAGAAATAGAPRTGAPRTAAARTGDPKTATPRSADGRGGRSRVVAPVRALEARVPFAALCSAIIVVTLLVVLGLNIQLSRGSYRASDLRSQQALLDEREQALGETLASLSAPGSVGAAALALGMVSGDPAFLRLAEGDVIGTPAPAAAPTDGAAADPAAEEDLPDAPAGVPSPTAAPTPEPTAEASAGATAEPSSSSPADAPTDAESTP